MPAFLAALPIISSALGGIGTLLGGIVSALSSAVGIVGQIGGAAFSAVQTLVGLGSTIISTVASVAKTILGALMSVGQFLLSLPGQLLSVVQGIASSILGVIGNVLGVLVKFGTALGGMAVGAVFAFAKGIQVATQSALEFARNAAQLSATSGLSYGAANQVQRRFGAFGVDGATVNGALGGNAGIFGMKAAAFGLPSIGSDQFIEKFARRFQMLQGQGLGGQLMAQSMLKVLGMDSPQFAALANLPIKKIREQQGFSSGVYSSLGLGGGVSSKLAVDLPLLLNKATILIDGLKMKVTSVFLPILESILDGVTKAGAGNIGGIGKKIEEAGAWIWTVLPVKMANAFAWITQTAQSGVDSLIGVAASLTDGLPKWLGGAAQWVADTLRNIAGIFGKYAPILIAGVANGLADFGAMVAGWMRKIGDYLADMSQNQQNPLRGVVLWVASAFDSIVDVARNFAATIAKYMAMAPTPLELGLLSTPATAPLALASMKFRGDQAYDNSLKNSPDSNLTGTALNFLNSPTLTNVGQGLNDKADSFQKTTADWAQGFYDKAMKGGQGIFDMLNNGANYIDPSRGRGGNIGQQVGGYLAGHTKAVGEALKTQVKPLVDNSVNVANRFQQNIGTERDRATQYLEIIANQSQEQTKLLRESLKDGNGPSPNVQQALGYLAAAISEQQGRKVLSRR